MTGVVVVGTGFGCVTHVRALRAAGFEVLALVGRDPAKTAARARLFGVPLALTSVDDALRLDTVAAVTIATPPHTHAPIALAAIEAGKHVICEKPFARDADEGRVVLAAARRPGSCTCSGASSAGIPVRPRSPGRSQRARSGKPRMATVMLHVPLLAADSAEVPDWWADPDQGGGWTGAHGSQIIDQVRVTLGEFESVSASLPHVADRDMAAEDAFVVHFRMRSGAVGVLQSTSGDWGPPIVITRVVGSAGTAWIEGVGSTVRVADATGTRTLPVAARSPDRDRPSPARRAGDHRLRAHDLPRDGLRPLHPSRGGPAERHRWAFPAGRARGGHLRRRGPGHGRAGRHPPVGRRAHDGGRGRPAAARPGLHGGG